MFLQLVGMLEVGYALFAGVAGGASMGQEMGFLGLGSLMFVLGTWIRKRK